MTGDAIAVVVSFKISALCPSFGDLRAFQIDVVNEIALTWEIS